MLSFTDLTLLVLANRSPAHRWRYGTLQKRLKEQWVLRAAPVLLAAGSSRVVFPHHYMAIDGFSRDKLWTTGTGGEAAPRCGFGGLLAFHPATRARCDIIAGRHGAWESRQIAVDAAILSGYEPVAVLLEGGLSCLSTSDIAPIAPHVAAESLRLVGHGGAVGVILDDSSGTVQPRDLEHVIKTHLAAGIAPGLLGVALRRSIHFEGNVIKCIEFGVHHFAVSHVIHPDAEPIASARDVLRVVASVSQGSAEEAVVAAEEFHRAMLALEVSLP